MNNKNLWFLKRTNEQRRERYKIVLEAGYTPKTARFVRDWRINKIKGVCKGLPNIYGDDPKSKKVTPSIKKSKPKSI